jgi:putative heme-binding domain-containing protein
VPIASTADINFLKMGRAKFEQSCSVGYCHGKAGRAGRGPRLRGKNWDSKYLIKVIENGVPNSSMAGWKSRLSGEETRAIAAYIGTLSKLGPNDPEPPLTDYILSSDFSIPAPLHRPAPKPVTDNQPADENDPSVIKGDPVKGKALFFDLSDDLNCAACHRFNSNGTNVGPDLSGISGRSAREMLKDIILPNAVSTDAGQLFSLTTLEGEQLEVVKVGVSSTRTKVYDVTSLPPVLRSIKTDQIKSFELIRPSAMPETYGQRYTLVQLLDLIAFLKSSEGEPVTMNDLF